MEESKWVSFTSTLSSPELFDFIRDLTGNIPGEGGLVTFPNSSWLMSVVLPHQPHSIGQPEGVQVVGNIMMVLDREHSNLVIIDPRRVRMAPDDLRLYCRESNQVDRVPSASLAHIQDKSCNDLESRVSCTHTVKLQA